MWGWLTALAVILLAAALPFGVCAIYNADGPLINLTLGFVRLKLFPAKKKEKKNSEPKKPKKPASADKKARKKSVGPQEKETNKGGDLKDFLPLVRLIPDFLGDLRHKLRVKRLECKVILAGDDPCDLAENYGRAWAGIGNLFPLLERAFVIEKRDVEVECDFTSDVTRILARLDLTITLSRLLSLVVRHGVRILKEYLKIMKSKKGGALK